MEKVYKSYQYPIENPSLARVSVDVITIDEDNDFMNIAYYNFATNKWEFHTDVLSDKYWYEPETFCWIYKPDYLKFMQ